MTAGRALISRLVDGGLLDSGGGSNHFTAVIVAALCAAGDYESNLIGLCTVYRARRDALVAALQEPSCAGLRGPKAGRRLFRMGAAAGWG